MHSILNIFSNFSLVCAAVAWLLAQLTKVVITFIINRDELTPSLLVSSGGMPSSHSATVCALTTAIAIMQGLDSPLLAICFVLSFIVMYDAAGVRRSAGEQAKTLNQIIEHLSNQKQFPIDNTVREIFGHTPFQVLIGALFGIAVPFVMRLFFNI